MTLSRKHRSGIAGALLTGITLVPAFVLEATPPHHNTGHAQGQVQKKQAFSVAGLDLKDQNGNPLTAATFQDRKLAMIAAYPDCPMVCKVSLPNFAKAALAFKRTNPAAAQNLTITLLMAFEIYTDPVTGQETNYSTQAQAQRLYETFINKSGDPEAARQLNVKVVWGEDLGEFHERVNRVPIRGSHSSHVTFYEALNPVGPDVHSMKGVELLLNAFQGNLGNPPSQKNLPAPRAPHP